MMTAAQIVGRPEKFVAVAATDRDFDSLVHDLASNPQWTVTVLNGTTARNKDELMRSVASAFQFPSYFGQNWDAFVDCFDEVSWRGKSLIVAIKQADDLLASQPEERSTLLEIFRDAFPARDDLPGVALKVLFQVRNPKGSDFVTRATAIGAKVSLAS
jgi:RNAse (barnase) inhibitor barstar